MRRAVWKMHIYIYMYMRAESKLSEKAGGAAALSMGPYGVLHHNLGLPSKKRVLGALFGVQ